VKISAEERFWHKVNRDGPSECWTWMGSTSGKNYKNGNGYGVFWDGKKIRKATHVAWELEYKQEFPIDKMACHHCDNPICVRPSHIYVGDGFTNAQDRLRRGRHEHANKTHCLRGHPFSGDNLVVQGTRRRCRICLRIRDANHTKRMNEKGYWKSGQSKGWRLRKDMQ